MHQRLYPLLLFGLLSVSAALAQPSQGLDSPNHVLLLDGHGDYVRLPGNIFDDLTSATIEAWVRWDRIGYFTQWFAFGADEQFRGLGFNNALRTSTLQFFLYDSDHRLFHIGASGDLPTDTWHHVAAVSGAGGMQLYLDGVRVGTNSYDGSFAATGEGPDNYLGKSHWGANLDFLGALDEVRVWSVARTAGEIRAAMARRLNGDEPGLEALWNFDGGCAETAQVRDATPHRSHGELHGDAHCAEAELPATVSAPRRLTGHVLGPKGKGLPALIEVRLFRDGQWVGSAPTDTSGAFVFNLFHEGTYDLFAASDQLTGWRLGLAAPPGDEHGVDLRLGRRGGIVGTILAHDGTPLPGVVVDALIATDGSRAARVVQSVTSDERGFFRLSQLRPGSYRVRCHLAHRYVYADAEAGDGSTVQPELRITIPPFKKGAWRTYDTYDGLLSNNITGIHQGADGLLWLTSAGSGVWSFDGETFTSLTAQDGLLHNQVNGMCESRGGALYFATRAGVSRLDGTSFTSFTTEER